MRFFCWSILLIVINTCASVAAHGQELAWKKSTQKSKSDNPPEGQISVVDLLDRIELSHKVTFAFQKQFVTGRYVNQNAPLPNDDILNYLSPILHSVGLGVRKVENIEE